MNILKSLSVRVLAALMDGLVAEEIAREHFIAMSTVRSHIKSLLRKVGVTSQLAVVAAAHRAGWSYEPELIATRA